MRTPRSFYLAAIVVCLFAFSSSGISAEWGSIHAGRDANGTLTAGLENDLIAVQWGRVKLASGELEDCITKFTIKSVGQNQVHQFFDEGTTAKLIRAEVKENSPQRKTLRLVWSDGAKLQDVTVFPDKPYIKIDYHRYPKWMVEIGKPGGLEKNGKFAIYGAKAYGKDLLQYPQVYYPGPQSDQPGPLNYKGWFIVGVFNPKNGIGFGRVMPFDVVDVIKLLWGGGMEFLSYFGPKHKPFTGYLFAVTGGADEIIRMGKQIVDDGQETLLGSKPLFDGEPIPFQHERIDTYFGGITAASDINGDGRLDIARGFWYENAPLMWHENKGNGQWQRHAIRPNFYPYTDDLEMADVDSDGDPDIIVSTTNQTTLVWFENPLPAGDPSQNEWHEHLIGVHTDPHENYIKEIEIHDMNGDGKLDVVTRAFKSVAIFQQENPKQWARAQYLNIRPHDGLAIGDLDNDKDPDLVLNGFWLENPNDAKAKMWSEHTFDAKWYEQSGDWQANNSKVHLRDMNGDDRLDIIIAQAELPGYPVSWYEAKDAKAGPWTEHVIDTVDYCHSLQVEDMDNDGDFDVVVGTLAKAARPEIIIFRNKGYEINSRAWEKQVLAPLSTYDCNVSDLDGDGDLDIFGCRNWNQPPLESWMNRLIGN